jgi:hypothetical protein
MEESPKKLIIGLIIGTMVVLSVMLMINRLVSVNPTVMGSEYSNFSVKLDKSQELNQSVSGLKSLVEGSTSGPLGVIAAIVNTLWNGIRVIFNSVGFFGVMLESLTDFIGLPSYIPTLLFMIVTLLLVFWLIDIIFRSA